MLDFHRDRVVEMALVRIITVIFKFNGSEEPFITFAEQNK